MTSKLTSGLRSRLVLAGVWAVILLFAIAVAWSWFSQGIVHDWFRQDIAASEKVRRLQAFFDSFGIWSPLVYFGLVTVEVVIAPIPGLMLYAPGGVIFGPLQGGLLALAGNVVGAGIACKLIRTIRPKWLGNSLSSEKVGAIGNQLTRHGGWFIFFARLNPLTSTDLISYGAGLTNIRVSTVMLATGGGMAPLCMAQAWMASELLDAVPGLIYPMMLGLGLYLLVVVAVVWRLLPRAGHGNQPRAGSEGDATCDP